MEIVEYETNAAMIAAIQDDNLARALVAGNPALAIVPEEIRRDNYAFAVRHYSEELLKGANDGIEELKAAHVSTI